METDLLDEEFEPGYNMPLLQPLNIPSGMGKSWWVQVGRWFFGTRRFKLAYDWEFPISGGRSILIPGGYVFDGASIPKMLRWIASPTGFLMIPSLIHDYVYEFDRLLIIDEKGVFYDQRIDKKGRLFWDDLFLQMCKRLVGLKILSYGAYWMVRLGGWVSWKRYRGQEDD